MTTGLTLFVGGALVLWWAYRYDERRSAGEDEEELVPASAAQLALVAAALRRARLTPGAAAAGFLWAAKDARRAWRLLAQLKRRDEWRN